MTLDELIQELSDIREKAGKDIAVRFVTKQGDRGSQHVVGWTELTDGYEDKVGLIFGGENVAIMDWPQAL